MCKDKLEEETSQTRSLKKELAEHREAQKLRSLMIDRNALASSPIHKMKIQKQASVCESRAERSSCGTDDVPLQKRSSNKKKLVQKY